MSNWKSKALELALTTDMSQRAIARFLKVPKSTVNDYLRSLTKKEKKVIKKPKVLVYDIETSPMKSAVWSLWQNNISLNHIQNDWYVLSYAAKWYGEKDIFYEDQRHKDNFEDDHDLLLGIWRLLDEADIVITHNGKRFDSKKLNSRFILNDIKPPSHYRHIDTLEVAKNNFAFTSNKLSYLTESLCKTAKKSSHGKFPGFELWKECLKGNLEAWEEMEEYNKLDVVSLEELYSVLSPWSNKLPNFDVYHEELDNINLEGNLNLVPRGYVYTNLGKYQRYECTETGKEYRGRTNLLSKEKRKTLKANIR